MIYLDSNILFILAAALAVVLVFVILRIIVYFVRAIPKWVYVLVMLAAFLGVAFIFFRTTVIQIFGF